MTPGVVVGWLDEGGLLGLVAAAAGGLAEGGGDAATGVGDGGAVEEVVDGEDLDAGVLLVGEVLMAQPR